MEEENNYENVLEVEESITVSGDLSGDAASSQNIVVCPQDIEVETVPAEETAKPQDSRCRKSNHIPLWLTILIATNLITGSAVASYYQHKTEAGVQDTKETPAVAEVTPAVAEVIPAPGAVKETPAAPAEEKTAGIQNPKTETAVPAAEQKDQAAAPAAAVAAPQKAAEEETKTAQAPESKIATPAVAADAKKDDKELQKQDVKPAAAAPAVQEKKISIKDVSPRLLKCGKTRFILIHADYIPQICDKVKDAKLVLDTMEACLDFQNKIENSGALLQNERIQIDNQTVLVKEIKNGILTYTGADKAEHSIPLAELAVKYATNYEYVVAETAKKEKKSDLLPAYFAFSGDYAATDKYAKRLSSSKAAKKKAKRLQAELPAIVKIAYTCTKDEQVKKELFSKFAKDIPDAFKK